MPLTGLGTGFAALIAPNCIVPALPALSRDAALLALSRAAADVTGHPALAIRDLLIAREAQASTGSSGAAIPHARLPGLAGCVVLLARLPQPIDWQAVDGMPVDILVLLLSPLGQDADHLKALARISRTLRDPATLPALRAATSAADMREMVMPQPALAG